MTSRINRRQFVSQAAVGAASIAVAPGFLANTITAFAGDARRDIAPLAGLRDNHILLILQLDGGNDGLNTIVPYGDGEYYRARPQVAIRPDKALKLNERLGLHPELVELKQMYDEGHLAIVQNVGYPNPNRSHFTSTEIWQQSTVFDPTQPRDVLDGWVGRYFEQDCANVASPALGLQVGDRATSRLPTPRFSNGASTNAACGASIAPIAGAMMISRMSGRLATARSRWPTASAPRGNSNPASSTHLINFRNRS